MYDSLGSEPGSNNIAAVSAILCISHQVKSANITIKMLSSRLSGFSRTLMTSAVRSGGDGGVPGANLPFQIKNRYRLTILFTAFFGSGLALPFILVRHQLLKK
ncbi:unnamed protein product [Meganyctiphanes norvegica]|uniref:Cytochrome c oxidase subunit 7C, mitochondrial n=1 Tax=Meganyctiphanes norvegica TaxID=48144 RepID=A0AAV2QGN2_MEGNR